MNWKEYKETPDEGMFEAIQKRLRVRRAWRIGGIAAAVVTVAVVAAIAINASKEEVAVDEQEVAVLPNNTEAVMGPTAVLDETNEMEERPSKKQEQDIVAGSIIPETQMMVLDVENPQEETKGTVSFAIPNVSAREHVSAISETATEDKGQASAPVDGTETSPQPKFGGGETPTPYHEDNLLWAPNIITPNGEKPENRVFKVVATSDLQDFRMHIYNRGGRLVYRTSDINAAWDATHGGSLVPQGAYVWVATFRDSEGVQRRETGTVTVVR